MKFGIGFNLTADVTKDQTKVGVDATITHQGVVDAGQATVMSAKNGISSMVTRTKQFADDKQIASKVKAAANTTKSVAAKATEVSSNLTDKAMKATANGIDIVADFIHKEEVVTEAETKEGEDTQVFGYPVVAETL